MNKEILSLETAQKLARREKAIEYMKSYIKNQPNVVVTYAIKKHFEKVLKILEVKNETR